MHLYMTDHTTKRNENEVTLLLYYDCSHNRFHLVSYCVSKPLQTVYQKINRVSESAFLNGAVQFLNHMNLNGDASENINTLCGHLDDVSSHF